MGLHMDDVVEIKPCPFCGSSVAAVIGSFVRCGSCGAVGPYGYTEQEAIARWNARPAEAFLHGTLNAALTNGGAELKTE